MALFSVKITAANGYVCGITKESSKGVMFTEVEEKGGSVVSTGDKSSDAETDEKVVVVKTSDMVGTAELAQGAVDVSTGERVVYTSVDQSVREVQIEE